MYATAFNRWTSKAMGPKRDVIGEIKTACEKSGLVFCASSHRAEHYFFMNMGRTFDSDVNDEKYADFYGPAVYCKAFDSNTLHATTADSRSLPPTEDYLQDWLVRTCELIDNYRPKLLYFDWWIHNVAFKSYLKKLAAYYYNRAEEWGEEVSINYKHEAFAPTVATFDVERGALPGISPIPWQTDTAIGKHSWGYTKTNVFKGARQIICDLVDIVSKNGMLLLNIGPKADGTITEEETRVLLGLGAWLDKNGEGIYGTTFYKTFGEGETNTSGGYFTDYDETPFTERDFRFTYKDGCVYAFWMRPKGKSCVIKTFARRPSHDLEIESVTLLETGESLPFERTEQGLTIRLPEERKDDLPVGVKLKLA
ncbi:MAG: alpha-L-fucosidase, partial [Clostridiales bacterium]|nr:alpha-L-fucosidase [Clostridiales bacterium]